MQEVKNDASPSLIKRLWKRYVNKETITYLIFGVLTTLVNYVAYYLFLKAPFITSLGDALVGTDFISQNFPGWDATRLTPLIVNVIAWVIAVAFAYITNKIFVFESKSFRPSIFWPELGKFILARLLSLGFEELFLFLTVTLAGWNELLSKILAAVFVVIINYFASKFLIFKHKKEEPSHGNQAE